jgi:hypothetical protein
MFANCTGLKTAPELPFKSNSSWNYYCYNGMFKGCTGLTTPPSSIPSLMHDYACYQMFYGCSKLTKTPAMSNCDCDKYACYQMFYGCSKLKDASNITITGTYSYSHY